MTEKLIDGKKVSQQLREKIAKSVNELKEKNIEPGLVVVLVGDDPASAIYVRNKEKSAQKLGMFSETIRLDLTISQDKLLEQIQKLNNDQKYHGILVQLPLPDHIDEEVILKSINLKKDVDCFHPENVGRLVIGNPYLLPCTPAGIIELLKAYDVSPAGKNVVIAGRSNIVGKPMANILIQKEEFANATVTVVHSRTKNIEDYFRNADIIIAAIGSAQFLKASMVKDGVVIIDVGMNRIPADNEKGYKLVGDADFDDLLPKVSKITPVPGGVGPMTITMLLYNTVQACKMQNNLL
ncbi:MAG: bifunctional methylenetetrahydrofolate dehydrogenase/methenyltetrahydrofolate cyclohydrolase FolD [Calditrichia bacterium]|nr:bifunctional methylenetetrahydrofolate dehydrogenase/methenyltetrahydrofolate cyclohydrolase FolD [Calditrichia bacterium]